MGCSLRLSIAVFHKSSRCCSNHSKRQHFCTMPQGKMRCLKTAADAADGRRGELQHSMNYAAEREAILQERVLELTGV